MKKAKIALNKRTKSVFTLKYDFGFLSVEQQRDFAYAFRADVITELEYKLQAVATNQEDRIEGTLNRDHSV